jgi:hypothetical protein
MLKGLAIPSDTETTEQYNYRSSLADLIAIKNPAKKIKNLLQTPANTAGLTSTHHTRIQC